LGIGTCDRCAFRYLCVPMKLVNGEKNETEPQRAVIEWASVGRKKGMEHNARKNKTMHITKGIQKRLSIE